ncbi:monocarboxylate transporter 9-like [Watersipora subatra]|uniref:monocarboxylate transporter 9-like n=1 Tax=Watersipora subatra TaxID=2589382 RepID=UPI00355B72D3
MALPIDRGWGWVVTFSCGCLFLWTAGFGKSRGIILVELMEVYPEKSATSFLWIFSLAGLVNRISGPFNGWLLARTSSRCVAMLGVGIMTLSLIAFAYVPCFECMYISYGVFYGVGSGMVLLTLYTASAPYFDKKRSLSVGLTAAGSGLGMTVIAILLRQLFDHYTFSSAILLSAGVCLQNMVLAALIRPFSYYSKWVTPSDDKVGGVEKNSSSCPLSEKNCDDQNTSLGLNMSKTSEENCQKLFHSAPGNIDNLSTDSSEDMVGDNHLSSNKIISCSQPKLNGLESISATANSKVRQADKKKRKKKFNWKLAWDPKTIALGLSLLVYCSGFNASLQCIPPLGKEIGLSKSLVSMLLSAGGIADMLMKVFNGWLADKKLISPSTHLALCMAVSAVTALLCATLHNTAGLVAMLIGITFAGTSVYTLMPVTCTQLFGKQNLESAMSIIFFYIGISNIVMTFSIGGIYDATGQWSYVYYYISAFAFLGCFLMSLLTFFNWRQERVTNEPNKLA